MCAGESNPYACPRRSKVSRIPRRLAGCARLHVGYLLRTTSVEQIDLPVRPLDQRVHLA